MRDAFDGYVAQWLALLEQRPSEVLARVVCDLAACADADRAALARRFAALMCGPRAEPDRVRLVMGQLARASGQAPPAETVSSAELEELGRRETALAGRLAGLEAAGESEVTARCRALETAVAATRERAEHLRAVLLRAGCGSEEVTL